MDMPGHEYIADYTNRVADTTNPILKPWAKKLMDMNNQRVLAGSIPFYPTSRCWPGGVPGLLLYPGEPVFFIQTPKEVWILDQRDSQVRRIYMNVPHSKNSQAIPPMANPSAITENGDTLVIDTIGLDDKGQIDRYRTPHTKQLHVVERYQLNNSGKNIEISFTVEDPGAFTMPWKGKVDFERGRGARGPVDAWEESICADGPRDYFADDKPGAVPIPQADRARLLVELPFQHLIEWFLETLTILASAMGCRCPFRALVSAFRTCVRTQGLRLFKRDIGR